MVFEREMTTFGDPDSEEEDAPAEEEKEEEEEEEEEEDLVNNGLTTPESRSVFITPEQNFGGVAADFFEKLKDPLETVREKCEQTEHCVHARQKLEACEARVSSRSETEEDCTEELFDFLHARDHCIAHKLFSSLK
ncbi:hypothetical protein NFI96_028420 [Prochilodus magdalenae]|nr:hypothetical protein NFI96_028420 [Prochilodus magdalenae]